MLGAPEPDVDDPRGSGESSYYTISQAAALLGVSRMSIRRWARTGRLPRLRLGHRAVCLDAADLERRLQPARPTDDRELAAPFRLEYDAAEHGSTAYEHVVQFYEDDDFLLDAVTDFIGTGLRAGEAGVVVATAAHRQELERRLLTEGLDIAATMEAGQYAAFDAAGTLARLMEGGVLNPALFTAIIGNAIASAAARGRRVRVFGEMVALLAGDGDHDAVLFLESLWNQLQESQSFSLFCAYPMEDMGRAALGAICAAHSRVVPAESYMALRESADRLRAVAELQQKAVRLEAEIAAREQTEEQLRAALTAERQARTTAEAALRTRDDFLSVAAHELKTPMTSLRGYTQLALRRLARDGQVASERLTPALEAVAGQTSKLARLVDHLLDMSRLEAGKLTLERQPTDVAALVEQVVSGARTWSEQHTIILAAAAGVRAHVDPLRLEQILTNLLDNAIKYSPEGSTIDVTILRGTSMLELSVRDFGLGICLGQREHIFERFHQGHESGSRSGMGLGLYISRQIVELHGGQIRAEFPPDGGTRIIVRLPIEPA